MSAAERIHGVEVWRREKPEGIARAPHDSVDAILARFRTFAETGVSELRARRAELEKQIGEIDRILAIVAPTESVAPAIPSMQRPPHPTVRTVMKDGLPRTARELATILGRNTGAVHTELSRGVHTGLYKKLPTKGGAPSRYQWWSK